MEISKYWVETPIAQFQAKGKMQSMADEPAAIKNRFLRHSFSARSDSRSNDATLGDVHHSRRRNAHGFLWHHVSFSHCFHRVSTRVVRVLLGDLCLVHPHGISSRAVRFVNAAGTRPCRPENFAQKTEPRVNGYKTRQEMEADEARLLAPFAQKSGESRGPTISRAISRLSDRIPARSCSDYSLARVSSSRIQDPSFPQRHRRSFAHAVDPHHRSRVD